MVVTKGKAQNVPISLYPYPHIEIINDAIQNGPYNNPAQFIQRLIEGYGKTVQQHFADFLLYLFYPFLIILLLMLYSYEIRNIPLSLVSGILGSCFFYAVFRWTLNIRGIDHKTFWKSKRRIKNKMEDQP